MGDVIADYSADQWCSSYSNTVTSIGFDGFLHPLSVCDLAFDDQPIVKKFSPPVTDTLCTNDPTVWTAYLRPVTYADFDYESIRMNINLESLEITVIGIVGGSMIVDPVEIRAIFELPNG